MLFKYNIKRKKITIGESNSKTRQIRVSGTKQNIVSERSRLVIQRVGKKGNDASKGYSKCLIEFKGFPDTLCTLEVFVFYIKENILNLNSSSKLHENIEYRIILK